VIYDLPFFKKDSNWIKKNVLGNWELAPIYTFQSPEYGTVRSNFDANLNGDNAGDRTIINPTGVPGTGSAVTPVYNSYFNTACLGLVSGAFNSCKAQYVAGYVAVNPNAYYITAQAGALANATRNTMALPRINNWDLTAVKRFSVREGWNFEFQAQALNVLNHPQYVPGSLNQINSIGYTSAAVTNALVAGNAKLGKWNQVFSSQERTMQLALKFTF